MREKEASLDSLINPIEDMYALLVKYEVRVPKEETDQVSDLRYSWKKLRKLASEVTDKLSEMQVPTSPPQFNVRFCIIVP